MRAGEVPRAHQELAHDLAARKPERLLEQRDPLLLRPPPPSGTSLSVFPSFRLSVQPDLRLQPPRERPMGFPQLENPLRVRDRRLHLEPGPHASRIGPEPPPVP